MFIGSIDQQSRIIVNRILDRVDMTRFPAVWVGCSGNFTLDRIAAAKGFQVHSNDVSLYSALVAGIVTGKPFPVKCVNPELQEIFADWTQSKYTDLIKVMFAAKIGPFAGRKNQYQETMIDYYRQGAKAFFDGTLDRFKRNNYFDFELAEFFYGDFKEHIANATGPVLLYAPTYKGGYEKLFEYINSSFEFPAAKYELFDSKTAGPYYQTVLQEHPACIYSDIRYPECEKWLSGMISHANKHDIYFYCSVPNAGTHFLVNKPPVVEKTPGILSPTEDIPERPEIKIVPCKVAMVNHYKHLFMSAKVDYSTGGDYALAFLMNNKVFGFASFSRNLRTISRDILFLHSDFVVPSKIERLSKLLLYLMRTREVELLITREYVYGYGGLQTSVFTDKPASMKYRGPFKKIKPAKPTPGRLTYVANFTKYSIKEAFEKWLKRKPLD
jgi:hypothetical protein